MCSRFAQSNRWSKAKAFQFAKDINESRSRFNIVYTEGALIILKPGTDYTVENAMFWLVAPWSKSLKDSFQYATGNAKSETIFELKSFKEPILSSRCIIPCDAVFESIGQSGSKQPYALRLNDDEPFGMAGIYSRWKNPETGERIQTFSIITVPSNELFTKYHPKQRMPVILPPENYEAWLDSKLNTKLQISPFFQIYPSDLMHAYPVSKLLLSPKKKLEGEECLKEISLEEKRDTLF
ncbi:SOS response-associated peptidase [Leptospira sp. 201903070]|uniref:Abasic site processing protein n=1 Tax=Leptospira ainlahdjerensis TaxID=2810033 RepID=A0ABS2UH70_9LEPT|nr:MULTISPECIES: SOS response-associated peptidase [Leptospira]MBM9502892.1 SOS response-associated peptidase [Leptospira ainazelensis]MBM9578888.1 SOS response-associated peptidase [Leptospira ainlahdjerensis]